MALLWEYALKVLQRGERLNCWTKISHEKTETISWRFMVLRLKLKVLQWAVRVSTRREAFQLGRDVSIAWFRESGLSGL